MQEYDFYINPRVNLYFGIQKGYDFLQLKAIAPFLLAGFIFTRTTKRKHLITELFFYTSIIGEERSRVEFLQQLDDIDSTDKFEEFIKIYVNKYALFSITPFPLITHSQKIYPFWIHQPDKALSGHYEGFIPNRFSLLGKVQRPGHHVSDGPVVGLESS